MHSSIRLITHAYTINSFGYIASWMMSGDNKACRMQEGARILAIAKIIASLQTTVHVHCTGGHDITAWCMVLLIHFL